MIRIGVIYLITCVIAWVVLHSVHTGGALILMLLIAAWPFLLYAEHGTTIALVASIVAQLVYCAGLEMLLAAVFGRRGAEQLT
jgi:hypothetical protein